jgi:hypothetical protein
VSEREAKLVAAAQAFIAATRGGILEAFIPWMDLRDALTAYPLHVLKSSGTHPDTHDR